MIFKPPPLSNMNPKTTQKQFRPIIEVVVREAIRYKTIDKFILPSSGKVLTKYSMAGMPNHMTVRNQSVLDFRQITFVTQFYSQCSKYLL